MIFEALLSFWPKRIFRGTADFGPLDEREVDEEIQVPWDILLTCSTYYNEAMPILYGKNKFAFCTGEPGNQACSGDIPSLVDACHILQT
jgi:secreted trypsin-like serine protease